MELVTKYDIVTHTILNESTGELESKDFIETFKKKKMRGGFNLIYHNPYEEIMELVVNSNKEMKLFNWVTNQFSKNRVETYVTFSVCKEDGIEISKRQFSEMVKILVREKYLMRIRRGIYRLNPFIYLPTMADAESLQREWKELLEAQKQIKEANNGK